MEGSEDSKMENSLKDRIDASEKVVVEEVGFGQVIEFPPEPTTTQDGPQAVEVVREGLEVENSGSSVVTTEKQEVESSNLVSGYEQKVEEPVVTSDIPISDTTNVEASSGVAGSVGEELDVDSSVPADDATVEAGIPQVSEIPPDDATVEAGIPQESEIPRSTEYQAPTTETHRTWTSWTSCCGLFDALRGSN